MKFSCFCDSTSSCCLFNSNFCISRTRSFFSQRKFSVSLPLDLFFFLFSFAFTLICLPFLQLSKSLHSLLSNTRGIFPVLTVLDFLLVLNNSLLGLGCIFSLPLVPFQLLSYQFRLHFLFLLFSTYFSTLLKVGCNDLGLPAFKVHLLNFI